MKLRLVLFILSFLSVAQTCNKEIPLPNPEMKKLFGKWNWIETSGGFTGKTITPALTRYALEIEFTKEGVFQKFKNEKSEVRMKFKVIEGKSIFSEENAYLLSLSVFDSSSAESFHKQSVRFRGSDTLYLYEECHDCFSHVYVRKK